MPNSQGTGLGVVARARYRPATAMVVLFSDYATEGIRRLPEAGADAAFQKGPDLQAFVQYCSAIASGQAADSPLPPATMGA